MVSCERKETVMRKVQNAGPGSGRTARRRSGSSHLNPVHDLVSQALQSEKGLSKIQASRLFERIAATSAVPAGKLRAELIPDASWKRARTTLGPQASQTTARLKHVLALAERVWGNEADATNWLNSPHPELRGTSPLAMLRTEAGGRAVEA